MLFRNSLQYGIQCLKILNYSKHELDKMREMSENEIKDVHVWSNSRVMRWVKSIGKYSTEAL